MRADSIIFIGIISSALKIMLRTRKISEDDLKTMAEEIRIKLSELNMSIENRRFLYIVFSNKEPTDSSMDLKTLKFAFHLFYEKCCEFMGPIETDKVISMALQKASEKDEALDFDPRDFLKS
jgi:hypothetical protein